MVGAPLERFRDRRDAGRALAAALAHHAGSPDVVVLGLPRGGVVVAAEVARALRAPLDALVVRKLGAPGQPELAMGAIASGGVTIWNEDVLALLRPSEAERSEVQRREALELARRERAYRGERAPLVLRGRTAILVDDGLATGASMRAALDAAGALGAASRVVAVPVGAREVAESFRGLADEVVCVATPRWLGGVGAWYEDFAPTSDAEVRALLCA